MGNCMRSFFKKFRRKSNAAMNIVLLIVGLDNAGKTSVLHRISNDAANDVLPTMGFRTASLRHKSCNVKVYDVGGAVQIRSIWPKYYSDVHGLIYVVDASDVSRLTENKITFGELMEHEDIAGKPILLLANKQDLQGAIDELDLVENLDVERVANTTRCPTRVETCSTVLNAPSANTSGITNGYKWLLDTISKNFASLDSRTKKSETSSISRVRRKLSSTSLALSRSSIRSNPFKPIHQIIADQNPPVVNSSQENLIAAKSRKKSALKRFLTASRNNKTAPANESIVQSQRSLDRPEILLPETDPRPDIIFDRSPIVLETLDPSNLASRPTNGRPYTAPETTQKRTPLIFFDIPGQVTQYRT